MTAPDPSLEAAETAFRDVLAESPARAAVLLVDVHPADAVEWLRDTEDRDRNLVFGAMPPACQASILEHADEALTQELIAPLDARLLTQVLEELPSDEAADVLIEADDRVANDALERLSPDTADALRTLLSFDPESAGGIMATDFVVTQPGERVGDVVKSVRKGADDIESEVGVFVLDQQRRPIGYLSDRALLTHTIHSPVEDVMCAPFMVAVDEDQEDVAQLMAKYGLQSVAVVDDAGGILGVISAEDAAAILEEEVDEDIALLVGVGSDQLQTRLPILVRVRQRLPLMGITVVAGLASAQILAIALGHGSEDGGGGVQQAILRYLPLIVGLAGNVGIQSSTIFVRGFATGEVDEDREWPVFFTEWVVGTLIGALCGVATWLVAGLIESRTPGLGAAVGFAVFAAVAWAAMLGGVIPIACRRLGIDPAVVAGPFLIALSDVSGSAIYIFVAREIAMR